LELSGGVNMIPTTFLTKYNEYKDLISI